MDVNYLLLGGEVRGQSICEICPAFLWCLLSGRGRGATGRLKTCWPVFAM